MLDCLWCDYSVVGESVSVIKHTDAVPDAQAVNQDKQNMLFSVSRLSSTESESIHHAQLQSINNNFECEGMCLWHYVCLIFRAQI